MSDKGEQQLIEGYKKTSSVLVKQLIIAPSTTFGCSKFSSFMCARFLHFHRRFTTRGCHGRLSGPWTIPEAAGLRLGQRDQIVGAVIQLQKDLKKELKSKVNKSEHQEKTSTIGGSSILSAHWSEGSERQWDLERRKLKAEQERVAEMFKR